MMKKISLFLTILSTFSGVSAGNSGFYGKLSYTAISKIDSRKQNATLKDSQTDVFGRRKKNYGIYGVGFGGNINRDWTVELMFYKGPIKSIVPVTTPQTNTGLSIPESISLDDNQMSSATLCSGTNISCSTFKANGSPITSTSTVLTDVYNFNYQDSQASYPQLTWNFLTPTLNLYYKLFTWKVFTPYIVLGGGLARQVLQGTYNFTLSNPSTVTSEGVQYNGYTVEKTVYDSSGNISSQGNATPTTSTPTAPSTYSSTSKFKTKKASVVYTYGIGLNVVATENIDLDFTYKIMSIGKIRLEKFIPSLNVSRNVYNSFELGLRYWF